MIDIIIPTYNNKKGLIRTLQSIPKKEELVITIIDDCSSEPIDYSDIAEKYNFIQLKTNNGPGNVRQFGIDNTSQPYIMFIDTDDYFLDDVFDTVINTINKCQNINIFGWSYISESSGKVSGVASNHLHGKVYKRQFLKKYNITFCKESSYINEDIGFNRICRLLTNIKFILKPIYIWTADPNSITRRNNREFNYKYQNIGLALNAIHIYNTCKDLVSKDALEKECSEIMGGLYAGVIKTAQERAEFLMEAWQGARKFYKEIYQPYINKTTVVLQYTFNNLLNEAIHKRKEWKKSIPLNINRFFIELDRYENPPDIYT